MRHQRRRKHKNLEPADPYAGLLRGGGTPNPMPAQDGFVDHERLEPWLVDPSRNPGALLLGCINAEVAASGAAIGLPIYAVKRGEIVASVDDRPAIVVAGTGQGKGTSFSIGNCLSWPFGLGVHDPKLEIVGWVAAYRTRVHGQTVHVLNPSGIAGEAIAQYQSSFNPLAGVDPASTEAVLRRAALVAEACVVPPESSDTHWVDNAREAFRMVTAYVLTHDRFEGRRNLQAVYELVMRLEMKSVKDDLLGCTACDGFVCNAAHGLFAKADKEFSSVVSSLRTAVDFLKSPAMRESLSGDGFDMADLPRGKLSVFYGVSPGQMETCRGFLRLVTASMINAFEEAEGRADLATQQGGSRTLLLIEEAGSLGRGFTRLQSAAAILRGYGARLVTVWQDVSQMKTQIGEGWETMFSNAGVQVFFGNTDLETSEYIAKRLGSTLVYAPSMGTPTLEGTVQRGESGLSYGLVSHPLMTPREIAVTFAREDPMARMLCFLPGLGPAILHKAHYHSHEAFEGMVPHAG